MSAAALAALIGRLIEGALRALPLVLAFLAGRARARLDAARRTSEIKDDQLDRAARRPRDRDELVRRLRRDGL
jgi:hypothetical protein